MLTLGGIALEYTTIAGSLLFLAYASIYDLRAGEIPKWTTYGLAIWNIFFSICAALIYQNFYIFVASVVVFSSYFVAAYFFYAAGQWGGGDVKLLGGVGASLGLLYALGRPHIIEYGAFFCILTVLYGVFYTIFGGRTVEEGREQGVMRFAPIISLAYLLATYVKFSFI